MHAHNTFTTVYRIVNYCILSGNQRMNDCDTWKWDSDIVTIMIFDLNFNYFLSVGILLIGNSLYLFHINFLLAISNIINLNAFV